MSRLKYKKDNNDSLKVLIQSILEAAKMIHFLILTSHSKLADLLDEAVRITFFDRKFQFSHEK